MANEIVKYDNEFNDIRLANLTAVELDLVMFLCSKMRDKKEQEMTFEYNQIKDLLNLQTHSNKRFTDELESTCQKLSGIKVKFKNDCGFAMFTLFPTFVANTDEARLTVGVNQKFAFLLNDLSKNFTRFELREFTSLTGKYAKNLYRLLKQYRRAGTYKASTAEFRNLLDCPEAYSNKQFMDKCIKPAIAELSHGYFDNLKVNPLHARKRGAPIVAYEFTFRASEQIAGQMSLDDYEEKTKTKKET